MKNTYTFLSVCTIVSVLMPAANAQDTATLQHTEVPHPCNEEVETVSQFNPRKHEVYHGSATSLFRDRIQKDDVQGSPDIVSPAATVSVNDIQISWKNHSDTDYFRVYLYGYIDERLRTILTRQLFPEKGETTSVDTEVLPAFVPDATYVLIVQAHSSSTNELSPVSRYMFKTTP